MKQSRYGAATVRACDGCRLRKVRCDYPIPDSEILEDAPQGGSCRRCTKLRLTCTFNQPIQTRGPKQRLKPRGEERPGDANLAEVTRSPSQSYANSPNASIHFPSHRRITDPNLVYLDPISSSRQSSLAEAYPSQVADLRNIVSQRTTHHEHSTDELCSRDLLALICDDFLRLIYVLIPVVHRPSFIRDFQNGRDTTDPDFHGLLISITAVVVAILPERFKVYQSHHNPIRFQDRKEMASFCYNTIMSKRGIDYFDRINHTKWAIAYLMRIAFYNLGQHNLSRMFDIESDQHARLLYFHKISEYEGLNCIEVQLRKKAFWLVFYSYVHNQLQSLRRERTSYLDPEILQTIKLVDLLPLEIDDEMIFEHTALPQPSRSLCITSGFIIHSRVFWAALRSVQTSHHVGTEEETCRCYRARNPQAQITHLKTRLREMRYMLDNIPQQLRQWVSRTNEATGTGQPTKSEIMESQISVMRGNIHLTHIWLQSILLDQLEALLSSNDVLASPDTSTPRDQFAIWAEREEIARQLLHILHSIPHQDLEPNGLHLTEKVRDVAVSLLSCPYPPEDEPSKRVAEYVREFTAIIASFDLDVIHTTNTQSWVDTARIDGHVQTEAESSQVNLNWNEN